MENRAKDDLFYLTRPTLIKMGCNPAVIRLCQDDAASIKTKRKVFIIAWNADNFDWEIFMIFFQW